MSVTCRDLRPTFRRLRGSGPTSSRTPCVRACGEARVGDGDHAGEQLLRGSMSCESVWTAWRPRRTRRDWRTVRVSHHDGRLRVSRLFVDSRERLTFVRRGAGTESLPICLDLALARRG